MEWSSVGELQCPILRSFATPFLVLGWSPLDSALPWSMTRLIQSPWAVALVGALVYLVATAALFKPGQIVIARPAPEHAVRPDNDPSWKFRNPELEQMLEEIRQEREALGTRRQQLDELQKRLDAEREELFLVTQTVHQLQVDFDKNVVRLKDQEAENIRHQAKIVAGMTSEGAATMLYQMPKDQMVRVLFTLKPDAAALILDALSKMGSSQAKRAAEAADQLRLVLPPLK